MKRYKKLFRTKYPNRQANRSFNNYAHTFELIKNLSKLSSENEIVISLLQQFATTFTVQKVIHTRIIKGNLTSSLVHTHPAYNYQPHNETTLFIEHNSESLAIVELHYSSLVNVDPLLFQYIASILSLALFSNRSNTPFVSSDQQSDQSEELQINHQNEMVFKEIVAERNKFQTLANLTFEGIVIHKNGIALAVNLAIQKMIGYSADELIGKNLIESLVVKEYRDKIYQNLQNGNSLPYEVLGLKRDGTPIWVEIESKIVQNYNNEEAVRVVAVRDISKRKEAEKAIEHERIFNLNLIETLPGIFFLYEMQENHALLLKWNKNHEIFLGYSNSDLYQMHVVDLFEADELPKLNYALELIKQKEEFEMELFLKHKNGTQVPYFLRGKGFENNGKTYFVGIGLDITEQKNIENELITAKNEAEKSEEKYRNWFEHFPHATYIWKKIDDDFEMVRANKKAYEESKGGIEKVFGIKSRILWQNEPDLTEYLVECYNTQTSRTIERKYYFRGSGEEKFTSTTYSFIPPDSIQIITIDITQQKIADDELKSQKLLFETMFNTISDAVIIADTNRKIILVNEGMHTTFGYEPNEIINHTPEELYENMDAFIDAGNRVFNLESKNIKDRYITYYRNKSNKIFPGETFGSKLFDSRGKWIGNLAIIRDVSEREALIADLIKARDLAEESNRLKNAFLLNMSHEIKTPMNAINGFAQLINKPDLSPEKRQQFSSIIIGSSKQLQSIVEDILTISALETKQHTITYQPLCVNRTMSELCEIFKEQAQTKEITLIAETALSDSESEIYTDKTKFTQILTNLIANAIKFTHEGSVLFGYQLIDSNLKFYVKDTGIGISLDMQEKIFERFVQVETGMIRQYGGNGLGLSISKGFIELLGGKIWVESTPQQGSTFYFTIPYTAVNNKIDDNISSKSSLPSILIAEDEKFNFLFIEALLSHSKLNIIHALDGNEAVDLCKSNSNICLVLMDIKMPNMDGHTAAIRIKELRPNLPIIAQTAYSFEQYSEKYGQNPFDDYITKPITEKILKEKINLYIKILE